MGIAGQRENLPNTRPTLRQIDAQIAGSTETSHLDHRARGEEHIDEKILMADANVECLKDR
jgi:hypothetical protein